MWEGTWSPRVIWEVKMPQDCPEPSSLGTPRVSKSSLTHPLGHRPLQGPSQPGVSREGGGGGGEEEEGLRQHSSPGLLAPKSGVGGRDRAGREQTAACREPKRKHSGWDWPGVRTPGRGERERASAGTPRLRSDSSLSCPEAAAEWAKRCGVCPPSGGQDRASGLGAAWHLEDACALVPSVLGTGPEPRGPLSGEGCGASEHGPLLSGESGDPGGLRKAPGSVWGC